MTLERADLVLVGGGGHASMLVDALRACGASLKIVVLDADPGQWGKRVLDVPVVGGDELLAEYAKTAGCKFAVGLGGIGNNRPRGKLFDRAAALGLAPLTIVHPRATVSPWAVIGAGCQILPGAIVNPGAALGANVIVNTSAVVEHDCEIGDHVHLATGAKLAGTVRVGEYAHIGAGATLRQNVAVGRAAVVGAGAVVVRDVLPETVVAGVPARELQR